MTRSSRAGGHDPVDVPPLPAPLIGRHGEIAAGRDLLAGGARLVTLTGPPGVGKTSLALALGADQAGRFADGATMVDLSPVTDPDLVCPTIADAFGAGGRRRPIDRLAAMLRRRELLLLLDNFEQVVTAAPIVSELLVRCPGLTILATSRISLRIRWEHELPVLPLGLPDLTGPLTAAAVAGAPAVRLFVERARAAGPAFALTDRNAAAITRICERLDGLPLAIELAAARARVLAPGAMLRQLTLAHEQVGTGAPGAGLALRLLTDGPRDLPARQQTLRNAIAWSHALLDPDEQRLFRRLAVFSGGGTLDAVERVCEAAWTDVASLVEKSLLRLESSDEDASSDPRATGRPPRVRMLELVREYALDQLQASDEADMIRQQHVRYFVELAEQAGPRLFGHEQDDWLARLDQERDNLLAAARRATNTGDSESVLRMGAPLFRFWRARGEHVVVHELVEGILTVASAAPAQPASVKTLHDAAELARIRGSYAEAHALYTRSLEVARQIEDRAGTLDALRGLCFLAGTRGQYAGSISCGGSIWRRSRSSTSPQARRGRYASLR